ncbi:MAG: EamA family transporter [Negativicutes bacterium]|nr:EamA family transporter [Negativicutes bacterium]
MVSNSLVFALLAMLLWGLAPLFGKLGLGGLEPLTALTIRSGVITLILVVFVLATGKGAAVMSAQPRDVAFICLEGLCAALLGQLAYYYALKYGELGKVTPVVAAFPLVAFVLGLLVLGEKLTWSKGLGALFVVIGVALLNYR